MLEPMKLINLALDGELSTDQAQALERWLHLCPDNQREFLLRVFEHQQIRERVIDGEYQRLFASSDQPPQLSDNLLEELLAIEERSAKAQLVDLTETIAHQQRLRRHDPPRTSQALGKHRRVDLVIPRWVVTSGAIAAGIVLLVALSSFWPSNQSSPTPPVASNATPPPQAYLVTSDQAQWASDTPDFELRAGQVLALESGQATLRFASSTVTTIDAGTTIEVLDNNRCRLIRGQLTGVVPSKASGFAVEVPSGLVTDLGTTFTVAVDDHDQSTIHVQQGTVTIQAQSPAGDQTEPLLLTAGMKGFIDPDQMTASVITHQPLQLANTGLGIQPGKPDPNWLVGAISTDTNYQPKPAVVASPSGPNGQPIESWQPNDQASRWLLIPEQGFDVPDEQRTTFVHRFALPKETALTEMSLSLNVWADNKVVQVRVNGQVLYDETDKHLKAISYGRHHSLVLDKHFQIGQNEIEFVIANGTGVPKPFNPSAFRAAWTQASIPTRHIVSLR